MLAQRARSCELDSSSSGAEEGAGSAFQKAKRELKGVLTLNMSTRKQSFDTKLSYMLKRQQQKEGDEIDVEKVNMQKQILREKLHQRKQKEQAA